MVNVILLLIGAVLANVIGTTGASMLLIRPFIRLNKHRIKPYHVVFFIFIVSNVGGCLTPIGDPPLFLGFLKGIPFIWTLTNLWLPWMFGVGLLSAIFYFVDSRNHKSQESEKDHNLSGKVIIKGSKNMIFLGITIAAVFLDPNVMDWVPAIEYHGDKFSYLREVIMLATAFFAFKMSDKECLRGNEFTFEPIREVAFLFVGIFATMMPALQLIGDFAKTNPQMVDVNSLYWATGVLSGVLDNAPTYLNFLSGGMGKLGLDIGNKEHITQFVEMANETGGGFRFLHAISVAAVFFGAFTYIGNAPNFMVKSIAEQVGIQMPSFVGYVVKYAIPILLPVFLLAWLLFFVL
jgi:Na+/H+ antiporter NhaD/arsenite permease-like protein